MHDCDQQIAAARDRYSDRGLPQATGHFEVIGPDPPRHIGDPGDVARRDRREPFAQQIEIGDAIDLIIVGDATVAIAETHLRPHVKLHLAAARSRAAAERLARGPAIAGKRPGDLLPLAFLFVMTRPCMLIGRGAR